MQLKNLGFVYNPIGKEGGLHDETKNLSKAPALEKHF